MGAMVSSMVPPGVKDLYGRNPALYKFAVVLGWAYLFWAGLKGDDRKSVLKKKGAAALPPAVEKALASPAAAGVVVGQGR